jgi:TrmH family RNA methyltransferase
MITKEIESLQHPIVKVVVKLRKEKEFRQQERSVLIAGKKLVAEIAVHTSLKIIFIEKGYLLEPSLSAPEVMIVTKEILKKMTGLENPEPIAALAPLPPPASLAHKKYLLGLDGIADPGNMGTLLRTALALGWEGAFITSRSTDPFNDKAIRAAKGASFRFPLAYGSVEELNELIRKNSMTGYIADVRGEPLHLFKHAAPIVLILGNESHGASSEAKKHYQSIAIPMCGKMESLNVAAAGAIMLYQLRGVL